MSFSRRLLFWLLCSIACTATLTRCQCSSETSRIDILLYYHGSLLSSLRADLGPDAPPEGQLMSNMVFFLSVQDQRKLPDPRQFKASKTFEGKAGAALPGAENGQSFTQITCDALAKRADNTQYLYIVGYPKGSKAEEAPPVLVGRTPLNLACHRLQARIQLLRPNQFSRWSAFQDKRLDPQDTAWRAHDIKRMGHDIVVLPDGRFVVLGGVRRLTFSLQDIKEGNPFKDFITRIDIYDPASGQMLVAAEKQGEANLALTAAPRAFFATALHETESSYQIVMLGGLTTNVRELAPPQVLEISKDLKGFGARFIKTMPKALEAVAQLPRAFHRVIKIRDKYALVGGITCHPQVLGTRFCQNNPTRGDLPKQHLFYTLQPQGQDQYLLAGGITYDGGKWREVPDAWQLQAKHIQSNGTLEVKDNDAQFSLDEARAGHVAVQIATNAYLLYGGYRPQDGLFGLRGGVVARSVELLRRIPGCQGKAEDCWSSEGLDLITEKNEDTLPPARIFAQGASFLYGVASPLPAEDSELQILITGGLIESTRAVQPIQGEGFARHGIWLRLDPKAFTENRDARPPLRIRHILQQERFLHKHTVLPGGQLLLSGGIARSNTNKIWGTQGNVETFLPTVIPDFFGPSFRPQPPDAGTEFRGPDAPLPDLGAPELPPPYDSTSPDFASQDTGTPETPTYDQSTPDTGSPDLNQTSTFQRCNPTALKGDKNFAPCDGLCRQGICWTVCLDIQSCPRGTFCRAKVTPGAGLNHLCAKSCSTASSQPNNGCPSFMRCNGALGYCVSRLMGSKEMDRCDTKNFACNPQSDLFCAKNPKFLQDQRCLQLCDAKNAYCKDGRPCIKASPSVLSLPKGKGFCGPLPLLEGSPCPITTSHAQCPSNSFTCANVHLKGKALICVPKCRTVSQCKMYQGTVNRGSCVNGTYCSSSGTRAVQAKNQAFCRPLLRNVSCAGKSKCLKPILQGSVFSCTIPCNSDRDCGIPNAFCHISFATKLYTSNTGQSALGFCRLSP